MKLIIANSTAGKVIGTGGEVIKMIQQEHNVKLFITNVDNPKEKRIQNERICTVKGDELSVNRCMIDLVERIAADEMADLDTNIDYPKCEDGDVIFGMERPVFMPGLGMGISMPGMAGISSLGPSYEDLFMLQEQTKALQAMSGLSQGHGGVLQVNPLAAGIQGMSSVNGGLMGSQPGLQLMMDPYKRLLGQKQDMEILTPEMAMMKDFSGNMVVDQYADPWPKQQQNQLQSLLLQNPTLAAQQVAAKQQTEQYTQPPQEQFFIPNSLTGSVQLGLGKRFTQATPTSASAAHELINRANGLTTSGIYQSPLMSHVATSNSIAAQTAAIQQAAQNAAIQQQIQLQALQQQTQPNPLIQQQNSSLQALQDAQLQVQAQAAQIQALQAQSNQLHSNNVAQAQLHAQVQAQLMMNQQNAAVHGHHSSKKQRYHPYGIPPPPPPPSAVEAAPMPPKQVSVAPQVQAPPTPSVAPTISQPATAAASS